MTIQSRTKLKGFFAKNAIPTETNFADLIDSALSLQDDGVTKVAGQPLGLVAAGGDQKRVLQLFLPATQTPEWQLSLSPALNAQTATTAPGLGVSDGAGALRLFIHKDGNLGIATNTPADRLTVQGGDLRVEGGPGRRIKVVSDGKDVGIDLVARNQGGAAGTPYIRFTHGELDAADLGTRIVAADNNTLRVEGSGANQITLHVKGTINTGTLGLGVAPTETLDVNGGARLRAALKVNGTATFDGNVGIGTTSPQQRLDVTGDAIVRGTLKVTGNATLDATLDVKALKAQTASLGAAQFVTDINAPLLSGLYEASSAVGKVPDDSHPYNHVLVVRHSDLTGNHSLQIAGSYTSNNKLYFRKIARTSLTPASAPWNEFAAISDGILKIPALDVAGNAIIRGSFDLSGGINITSGAGIITNGGMKANGLTVTGGITSSGGQITQDGHLQVNGSIHLNGHMSTNGFLQPEQGLTTLGLVAAVNAQLGIPSRNAVRFNSLTNFLSLANTSSQLPFNKGISIQAWVYVDSGPNNTGNFKIIELGGGGNDRIELSLMADGRLFLSVAPGNGGAAVSLVTPQSAALVRRTWTHVGAFLGESGNCTIFVNGKFVQSGPLPLPRAVERTSNIIGVTANTTTPFHVAVSDLSVWTGASPLRMDPLAGDETGLVGYWKFASDRNDTCKFFNRIGNATTVGNSNPPFDLVHNASQQVIIAQEEWIPIVLADAPFWITPQSHAAPAVFKDSFGVVHWRGAISAKNISAPIAETGVFLGTLDAGYRPQFQVAAVGISSTSITAPQSSTPARIDVMADGKVQMRAGHTAFISFDGITHRAHR